MDGPRKWGCHPRIRRPRTVGSPLRSCLVAFLAAFLLNGLCLGVSAQPESPLPRANQRWKGAVATLRVPVRLQRGRDADGWTSGWWRSFCGFEAIPIQNRCDAPDGTSKFSFLLRVSDRERIAPLLRHKELPPGTAFSVERWWSSSSRRGFVLELRFVDAPARARLHFAETREDVRLGMPWSRFDEIEQFIRVKMLDAALTDELLETVATPAKTPAPEPQAGPARSTPPVGDRPGVSPAGADAPAVRVQGTSARPARIAAGSEIELVVTFTLEGVPPDADNEVVITHEIWQGDGVLVAALPETVHYRAGTFTNVRRVRSDPGQAAGLYTLRSRVEFAGVADVAEALLAIEAPR